MKFISLDTLRKIPLEIIYLVLGLCFGLVFLFLSPLFTAPDEYTHFLKTIEILLYGPIPPNKPILIPDSLLGIPFRQLRFLSVDRTKLTAIDPILVTVNPLMYLPQVTGFWLGWVLKLPAGYLFYLGRLFNLLVWVAASYTAIKLTPVYKKVFFFLLLMPMPVYLSASLSYDVISNATLFLFLGYIFKLIFDERKQLEKLDVLFLVIFAILIGATSKANFLFILMVTLVPPKKFASWKQLVILQLGLLILVSSVFLSWNLFIQQVRPDNAFALSNSANPIAQIKYLLTNPFHIIQLVIQSLKINQQSYITNYLGYFGKFVFPLPFYLYFVISSCTLLIALTDTVKPKISLFQRIWILMIGVGCTVGIFLALYLTWSPVGAGNVTGVQGRYFIPLIPLFLFALFANSHAYFNDRLWRMIQVSIFYTLLVTIGIFISIYYLPVYQPQKKIKPYGPTAEIIPGVKVRQSFSSTCKNLHEIGLQFVGYQRQNRGDLMVSIVDRSDETLIYRKTLDISKIIDNEWLYFQFKPQSESAGNEYQVRLTASKTSLGQAVSVWRSQGDSYLGGALFVNDVMQDNDLVFRYRCDTNAGIDIFHLFFGE